MIYICCVGFPFLDVICDELMIVPGILVCSSFLISVCMFIVLKALLIASATVIVRAGGAIWLNPFATTLFTVCSAVTVECCVLYPFAWVCLQLCKKEGSCCCLACLTAFVNCLVIQFAICLGVVAILLWNVWNCLLWVLCWIDRVWSSKECACCASDPSLHPSVPSIGFVYVFVCRKVSPHLRV